METHCKNCGRELEHICQRKPKKYCNDNCRMAYWREHPEEIKRTAYYQNVCGNCGRSFESYGNAERIYCSRSCYYEMRYVKRELSVARAQKHSIEIKELPPIVIPEVVAPKITRPTLSRRIRITHGVGEFPEPKRIWLLCGATWFSGKIDHFAGRIPAELGERLMEEDAFVFCNRQRDLLSLLQWQGDGFALFYKRLEYGKYPWPRAQKHTKIIEISPTDFLLLLAFPDFLTRCERGDFSPLAMPENRRDKMLF